MAREDFTTYEGQYDANTIYVKASDHQGHSWKGRVNLPKSWPGEIERLVEDPRWPEYRTTADFIRDAVYHRLQYWSKNPDRPASPELDALLSLERTMNRLEHVTMWSGEVQRVKATLDSAASELNRSRDHAGLADLLDRVEDEVRLHFSEPYLTDLLDRITYWRKHTG